LRKVSEATGTGGKKKRSLGSVKCLLPGRRNLNRVTSVVQGVRIQVLIESETVHQNCAIGDFAWGGGRTC